jgi:hypothetical protein
MVAVAPVHISGLSTVTVSVAPTVTVATAVLEHVPVVPVTVYDVVEAGETVAVPTPVTTGPAVQVYDVAPVAVKLAVTPGQMVGELTKVTGVGLTVTVATAVPTHPAEVPVTV